jgi:hypothetical protein
MGVLINHDWVLTTAHGFAKWLNSTIAAGVKGEVSLASMKFYAHSVLINGSRYSIRRVIFHPSYGVHLQIQQDLALVQLEEWVPGHLPDILHPISSNDGPFFSIGLVSTLGETIEEDEFLWSEWKRSIGTVSRLITQSTHDVAETYLCQNCQNLSQEYSKGVIYSRCISSEHEGVEAELFGGCNFAAEHGDSGGPLLDSEGRLVGITVSSNEQPIKLLWQLGKGAVSATSVFRNGWQALSQELIQWIRETVK